VNDAVREGRGQGGKRKGENYQDTKLIENRMIAHRLERLDDILKKLDAFGLELASEQTTSSVFLSPQV
jgi:hypothetical protein